MGKIIAITGAKATGKSTLMHSLSGSPDLTIRYADGITAIQSPGRRAVGLGLSLGSAGNDDTHLYFAREHLVSLRRAKLGKENELFLLDRCFIDHCAYVNILKDLMDEILKSYIIYIDHVFITALVYPFLDNETANETLVFRQSIETEIWNIINNYSVPATLLADPLNSTKTSIDLIRDGV
jgi:predicted ATPase